MERRNPRIWTLSSAAAVGVGCFVLARIGLQFVDGAGDLSTIWPAAGFALAVLIIAPRRRWPVLAAAIALGTLAAALPMFDAIPVAIGLSLCAPLQALAAAAAMTRIARRPRPSVGSLHTVGGLIAAGVGTTLLTTLPAAAIVALDAHVALLPGWKAWWMANAMGILVVTPVLLALLEPDTDGASRWESAGLVALTGAAAMLLFWRHPGEGPVALRFALPLVPLLLWCAVRIGPRATTFATLLMAIIASAATVRGLGPFAAPSVDGDARVQVLQGFLAIAVLSTLLVGAVVADQRRARALADHEAQRLATALRALAASEERHRLMLASLPDAEVYLLDGDLRCVLGEGAGVPTELRDARCVGLPIAHLLPSPGPSRVAALCEAALDGRPGWVEYRSPRTGRLHDLQAAPYRDQAGAIAGVLLVMRDITERDAQLRALRRAERDLRTLIEQAPIGHAILDAAGEVAESNAALTAITGYEGDLLRELGVSRLVHPDDRGPLRDVLAAVRGGRLASGELEVRLTHRDGRTLHLSLHIVTLGTRTLIQVVDVSDRKRLENQLRALADRDPLTGLLNRRRFDEEVEAHVQRCRRYGPEGALLLLDIDEFKHVNDTFGHHVGDERIVALANLLRRRLRSSDVVGRLGGDEFAVLLPRASRADAERVAAALVEAVRAEMAMTISLGVAMVGAGGARTSDQLMIAADRAMYEAKAAGRDGHAFFVAA